jgi:hypothetical protein
MKARQPKAGRTNIRIRLNPQVHQGRIDAPQVCQEHPRP